VAILGGYYPAERWVQLTDKNTHAKEKEEKWASVEPPAQWARALAGVRRRHQQPTQSVAAYASIRLNVALPRRT
jgi:hypothetical protein